MTSSAATPLAGKTALVTGSTSGIGLGIANALLTPRELLEVQAGLYGVPASQRHSTVRDGPHLRT